MKLLALHIVRHTHWTLWEVDMAGDLASVGCRCVGDGGCEIFEY